VADHFRRKEIWLYIKGRIPGRGHILATFVTNYFLNEKLWFNIIPRPFDYGQSEKKFTSSSEYARHTRRIHTKCLNLLLLMPL